MVGPMENNESRYSSPPKVESVKDHGYEPVKEYAYADDKWQTPGSTPDHHRPLRRQPPRYDNITAYGDYSDYGNNDRLKVNENIVQNENHDDYSGYYGGWVMPSRSTWVAPPSNDATIAPPLYSSYTAPVSKGPKKSAYAESIESIEVATGYGYLNSSPWPLINW